MLAAFANEGILEAGLDEAGRGPLFGPVYVAACVLPQDDSFDHSLIRDSKKLTKKKREWAFDYIKNYAIDYNNNKTIELKNIEDSFASAANYLKTIGWKKNQPCFFKVELKTNIPKKYLNSSARNIKNKK